MIYYTNEKLMKYQITGLSILLLMELMIIFYLGWVIVKPTPGPEEKPDVPAIEETSYQEAINPATEVYVTNYYIGDGSTQKTGSGLKTSDFDVNSEGWYTYNGKVVIATATYQGLASNYGILENYKQADPNIKYFNYFDELVLTIDGSDYECIVLDTCGASHDIEYLKKYDNGVNRVDIFIADKKYSFGKLRGIVSEV